MRRKTTGKKKTRLKKWAVWDLQTNQYIHSGYGAKTKKEAIEGVWNYWEGGANLPEKDIKKLAKDKEGWLTSIGFRFDELDKKELVDMRPSEEMW